MTENLISNVKLQNKFERLHKSVWKELCKYLGESVSSEIKAFTLEMYVRLHPTVLRYGGILNIFNIIMDYNIFFISLYLGMKKSGFGAKDAVVICYKIAEEKHFSIPVPLRWVVGRLIFSRLFLSFMKYSARNAETSGDWKIHYFSRDRDLYDFGFECTKCGVVNLMKQNGGEELTLYSNFIDYIQSNAFNLGWQNPCNIGQGNKSCIGYMKKNRKTEIPKNLRDIVSNARLITERVH